MPKPLISSGVFFGGDQCRHGFPSVWPGLEAVGTPSDVYIEAIDLGPAHDGGVVRSHVAHGPPTGAAVAF